MTHTEPRCSIAFRIAIIALACATFIAPAAADGAEVEGKLINVTQGGRAVPSAEVRLLGLSEEVRPTARSATTDATGSFRFRSVKSGPSAFYRIETTYAGLRQTTEPFLVNEGTVTRNLALYDTTSSGADITVEKVHIIANPDANGVGITSIYIAQNWGPIFLGDPPTADDSQRTGVRFLVPENATDFQILQGMLSAHHKVTPWGFASTIPFYPGSDTLVYSYVIPWQGTRASFEIESPYRIASLSVIAMSGTADLRVEGGEPRTSPMGAGMGQQLVNVGRANIPPNTPVAVEILPPGGGDGGTAGSLSVGQWLVIAASVAMVAVILFGIYVRRKQRAREESSDLRGTGTFAAAAGSAISGASLPESQGTGDSLVDSLVQQIADLDDAYEKGQIGEAEYVSRRRALKAELMKAVKAE